MVLSTEQIDHFHREGFLKFDPGFDEVLLDDIVEGVTPHYGVDSTQGLAHGTRVQDAWRFDPMVRALALDDRILVALRELYGRSPLPFQTLNFPVGTEQKAHSDTIHFNSRPAGFMAGVWVALEDVDEGNGALEYYPRSHRLAEVTMQDVGVAPRQAHYADYERHIEKLVRQHRLAPVRGVMGKGEVFIWHGNLLHGGGSHPDKQRSRHSQVTHYFFEGCDYYTPMLSSESEIFWRNPDWISADAPYVSPGAAAPHTAPLFRRVRWKLKRLLQRG